VVPQQVAEPQQVVRQVLPLEQQPLGESAARRFSARRALVCWLVAVATALRDRKGA
tara:strand:+ start:424 stop:591 length:168 start_codon:yes stop_codon:yes gene_type:complete